MGGTQHGRDAIRDVFNVFFDAFTNAAFTTEDLIIDGDRVAHVITFSAIDNGGLMGTAPSGKLAVVPVVFVCRVAEGLIQHERRIYDFTGLLVQVGVLKARPA
jgi:predicted ester cyclase